MRFQLSEDVRQRMREASHSSEKPQSPKPESRKPDPGIHRHHLTLDTTFFLFIQRLCYNVISASVPFTHKTTVMKGVVLLFFFSYNALMACFTAPGGHSSAEMPEELRKRSVIFSSPERVSKCV